MNWKSISKRFLVMLLVLSMVTGLVPVSAFAVGSDAGQVVDAAIIFSDLHTSKNNYKESIVKDIFDEFAELPVSSVTSAGDAFSVNADNDRQNGKYTGDPTKITGYIRTAMGDADLPVNYVWSDHDRYAEGIDRKSGLVEYENYYIYKLSMGDLCSYDRYEAGFNYTQSDNSDRVEAGFTATVPQAIAEFEAAVADLDKTKPLFIVSHQPLLDNRNDNAWAEAWFDSINEVAEEMDVAFFYGHNHKYDSGSDYYYAKGSQMPVATADKWGWDYDVGEGYLPSMDLSSESKILNFTHICAGYMDPSTTGSTSYTTRQGTAMAITIYEDSIQYTTYDKNGVFKGNYAVDKTVKRDHAGSAPEASDPVADANTGITVAAPGVTAVSVEVKKPEYDTAVYAAYASYDISLEGYEQGTEATVSVPAPEGFDVNKPVLVLDQGNVIATPDIVEGKITFTTDHFSVYDVAQAAETAAGDEARYQDVVIEEAGNPSVSNTNATTITSGSYYVLRCRTANQKCLSNTSNSNHLEFENGTAHYWYITSVGNSGYTVQYGGPNGPYLTIGNDQAGLQTASNTLTIQSLRNGSQYYWDIASGSYHLNNYQGKGNTASGYTSNASRDQGSCWNLLPVEMNQVENTYSVSAEDVAWYLGGTNQTAELSYALLRNGTAANITNAEWKYQIVGDTDDIIESIDTDGTIHFNNIAGTCDVKVSCTWTEGDKTYTAYRYVTVSAKAPNNYPEYPDEGAVKVNKTGHGIDFQSSGIAQVELSASGVPIRRGIDVIVMLDLSSSMTRCIEHDTKNHNCSSPTRLAALQSALETFESIVKNSNNPDLIRVAVADFNVFYSSGPAAYDSNDYVVDTFSASGTNHVFTGDGSKGIGGFVPATSLDVSTFQLNTAQGTNYDYAFDTIYQLGLAVRADNERKGQSDRELFVLFMSDGAANQFNFFRSTGDPSGNAYSDDDPDYPWNFWLDGTMFAQNKQNELHSQTHSYYFDSVDHDGDNFLNEHRMANAIKGDPNELYEVIRKNQNNANAQDEVSKLLVSAGKENLYTLPGLGATMYSVGFDIAHDGPITDEAVNASLRQVATSDAYYIDAADENDLKAAFMQFAAEVVYAANNARFVDQMGENYDLQMKPLVNLDEEPLKDAQGNVIQNKIEIISYDIWTRQEYLDGKCDESKIGDRKGTYTVLETVTFSDDGTQVFSDQKDDGQTNILDERGVIQAKNFLYNTNVYVDESNTGAVAFSGVSIPTGVDDDNLTTGTTSELPAETFYWLMGTVHTSEMAMRYYVYLEGSKEGTREAGSYPTNEYATLYYNNYLNKPCYKDTVSPVLPWKEANVSYAFYLVDKDGKIVVNQTTGETGSFANKVAVTNPVVYDTVLLNSTETINAVEAAKVLPEGYTLFDGTYQDGVLTGGASYQVSVRSDDGGRWKITTVKPDTTNTTYVTQYDVNNTAAYSNTMQVNSSAYDYTHTVVWFAVVWSVQALPDTVVVDYGLPVDISVMNNDMFGEKGKLVGVGEWKDSLRTVTDRSNNQLSNTTYSGTYGTAEVKNGKVRYTLSKEMGMQMNSHERFGYSAQYTGETNSGYYYETVTVIPATTIYYEDSFLTLKASGTEWGNEGTTIEGATQGEDRPGKYSLTDANNIYGYDGVNNGMSQFSLGTAKKVHVDAGSSATADFTFCGTGFDIISMTSNTTGVLAVKVTADADVSVDGEVVYAAGSKVCAPIVDTYYGYTTEVHEIVYTYTDGEWVAEDKGVNAEAQTTAKPANPQEGDTYKEQKQVWVPAPNMENAIYQVPVIQVNDLPYGSYDVTLTATYMDVFDHTSGKDGYDLYLDAVRIYDPANDGAGNQVIEKAYTDDHEGWPSYIELRNVLIKANKFDGNANDVLAEDKKMEGVVFIDGDSTVGNAQISDYINFGPNNEVYLAPGQRVAFMLSDVKDATGKSIVDRVHVGIKSADGKTGTYTITNIAKAPIIENDVTKVAAGVSYNSKAYPVSTTTDMYYDMTAWKNDIIVIANAGTGTDENGNLTGGIISITNIKTTYTAKPSEKTGDKQAEVTAYMTPRAAALTLKALKPAPVNPFADVKKDEFYYNAVLWAVEKGITNGVDAAHFGPFMDCNRAQVVTFLWRAAGSPAPVSRNNPFSDVPADSWYTDAVLWAVENGITNGLTATTFGPDALCNRAQVVTFLWRANGSRASVNAVNLFTDVPADAFYHDAVVWALENGITTGATDTAFDPNGTCMRAHVVTFLYRAAQLPKLELSGMKSES